MKKKYIHYKNHKKLRKRRKKANKNRTETLDKQIQKNHIVAFIDILGYSNLLLSLNDEESDKHYLKISRIYQNLDNLDDFDTPFSPKKDFIARSGLIIRFFSDNILLAVPCVGNKEENFDNYLNLLFLIMGLQHQFLCESNSLLRGGVTIGKFVADERCVYGAGLVKAAQLEKEAKFPRVILDSEIFKSLYRKPLMSKELDYKTKFLIIKDNETFFLNYQFFTFKLSLSKFRDINSTDLISKCPSNKSRELKKKVRLSLIHLIKRDGQTSIPRVLEKIEWATNYFNIGCKSTTDTKDLVINYEIEKTGDEITKIFLLIDEQEEQP